jgi:hypothetical protein
MAGLHRHQQILAAALGTFVAGIFAACAARPSASAATLEPTASSPAESPRREAYKIGEAIVEIAYSKDTDSYAIHCENEQSQLSGNLAETAGESRFIASFGHLVDTCANSKSRTDESLPIRFVLPAQASFLDFAYALAATRSLHVRPAILNLDAQDSRQSIEFRGLSRRAPSTSGDAANCFGVQISVSSEVIEAKSISLYRDWNALGPDSAQIKNGDENLGALWMGPQKDDAPPAASQGQTIPRGDEKAEIGATFSRSNGNDSEAIAYLRTWISTQGSRSPSCEVALLMATPDMQLGELWPYISFLREKNFDVAFDLAAKRK